MLETKNLSKKYYPSGKNGETVAALQDVTLNFGGNGFVAVVGKSGSGKTTLLNMLGGMDRPTSGAVSYKRKELNSFKTSDYDDYRNFEVGFVFQDYNLLKEYTVIDNIKIAVRLQEDDKTEIDRVAEEALKKVGLSELKGRKISTLSGGQQQRAVIARALAKDSRVILCDEPTGNLDSKTELEIMNALKDASKDRLVIVVTHDEELAGQFADRIVRLKDGTVAEDRRLGAAPIESEKVPAETNKSKTRKSMALADVFRMVWDNIKHFKLASAAILALFLAAFTLTTAFASLTAYDSFDSFVNTLKANEQTVIQITKYIDQPTLWPDLNGGEDLILHGPRIWYEAVKETDIPLLYAQVDNKANFYPSYFFNKNFQDFTDSVILPPERAFPYEAVGFREAVAVADFTAFHMPLLYGRYPESADDVLVYDYIIYSLIQRNILNGTIRDSVGTVLTDSISGLSFRLSGVLKSDYERYAYIKTDSGSHNFEETYLTSLQTVFCKPAFIAALANEKDYKPIFAGFFLRGDTQTDAGARRLKYLDAASLSGVHFLAAVPDIAETMGVILTKAQAAALLGISENALTVEDAESLLANKKKYSFAYLTSMFDYSIERTYYFSSEDSIVGIADSGLAAENGVLYYYDWDYDYYALTAVSAFRQIYLSLGDDWNANRKTLSTFIVPLKDDAFYSANPDYFDAGYTDYTAYGVLINNADFYLRDVKNFSRDIVWMLAAAAALGEFFFAYMTIKKYAYKIGVLKAIGAKNGEVSVVFATQIFLISLAAFALSVPASFVLMDRINNAFVSKINSNLVFFSVRSASAFIVFGISIVAAALSSLVPLLKLKFSSPVSIIRKNKN
jgi:ABC-type lipoprotein export system ATPase subunit/ABC-type antimicrobial peptide transport system permease subunit